MKRILLSKRDHDYVESRLIVPSSDLMDAMERLRDNGEVEAYNELMEGYKEMVKVCRSVRLRLERRP